MSLLKIRRQLLPLMIVLLLLPSVSRASGRWTTLTEDISPDYQILSDDEFTGEITMTFLGDCTLGGEEASRGKALGFFLRAEENGLEYPLRNISCLTLDDDLTVANLECVLTEKSG